MEEGVRLSENVVDAFTKAISLIEETMEAIRLASSNHDVKEATKTREILQQKEERILQRFATTPHLIRSLYDVQRWV